MYNLEYLLELPILNIVTYQNVMNAIFYIITFYNYELGMNHILELNTIEHDELLEGLKKHKDWL